MWAVVGLAFVAVALLGLLGFTRYQQAGGALEPLATRAYRSLQLFVLESGSVPGAVPWELQVARFAAPLVAAYAIAQALATVFREQVEAVRLQFVRDHVVVAGLGRKGRLLAQSLLRRGNRVVVIEADAGNAELDAVRAIGGLVVVGDARSPETQRRARLRRASDLVVLCGDDATNIEIAARAREEAGGRRSGSLQCVVHLVDPDLCLLLCTEELERYRQAPVRFEFVNVYSAAAQALLRAHPPFPQNHDAAQRVVVVGAGPTARHVLVALARAWATRGPRGGHRLAVTVVGADPQALSTLGQRHPELDRFAELQAVATPAAAVAEQVPAVIYVCPDDDAAAVASALELRSMLVGRPVRVVVVLEQRSGLGRLLEGAPRAAGGPSLATFGLLDETCQPEALLTGATELMAQALHRAYLDAHAGAASEADPALRPWSDLPEGLRESNRDQAAHVAVKLAAVGHTVGPLVDWDTAQQPCSADEVETMARLEHDRWVAERMRAGWQPGPRDPRRHTTPYLVPWEHLSEEVRDQDRLFVRQLPRLLASVGLQAQRRDVTERSRPGEVEEGEDRWVSSDALGRSP
jgi:voltage-gated potassium channel Kch